MIMKENENLKFNEEKLFNSESLQQYDEEGQKYFLGYLFRKGYKFQIIDKEIIFIDITSEKKVNEIIEHYNNDVRIDNLNVKREAIRAIRVMGTEEYSKSIEKKLRELKKRENEKRER